MSKEIPPPAMELEYTPVTVTPELLRPLISNALFRPSKPFRGSNLGIVQLRKRFRLK